MPDANIRLDRKLGLWTVAMLAGYIVAHLMRLRAIGVVILVFYSLPIVILRAPECLAVLRKSLSHWRQAIRELNATSRF